MQEDQSIDFIWKNNTNSKNDQKIPKIAKSDNCLYNYLQQGLLIYHQDGFLSDAQHFEIEKHVSIFLIFQPKFKDDAKTDTCFQTPQTLFHVLYIWYIPTCFTPKGYPGSDQMSKSIPSLDQKDSKAIPFDTEFTHIDKLTA